MKRASSLGKKPHALQRPAHGRRRAGRNAYSLRPPSYTIGFVDDGLMDNGSSERAFPALPVSHLQAMPAAAKSFAVYPPAHGGQRLPDDVQAKMENAFDVDFSTVRIHEGPQASAMDALAYTRGTDIHFAPGQYNPASERGQKLLGHELTHVWSSSRRDACQRRRRPRELP